MTLQGEAVAWVQRVLAYELPLFGTDDSFAKELLAVNEEFGVPVETLIAWLRQNQNPWDLQAWRAWCVAFESAAALPPAPPEAPRTPPNARKLELCPLCLMNVVQYIDAGAWWFCQRCGVVHR